jgi:hypothetical protein
VIVATAASRLRRSRLRRPYLAWTDIVVGTPRLAYLLVHLSAVITAESRAKGPL